MNLESFKEKIMSTQKNEKVNPPTELDPALQSLVGGGSLAPMPLGGGSTFGKVTWNKAI